MKENYESYLSRYEVLIVFKRMCDLYMSDVTKLRKIIANSSNKILCMQNLVEVNLGEKINEEMCEVLYELLVAFLNKKKFRKPIEYDLKKLLLEKQKYKCAFCGTDISTQSHADHIIPFKYVGDELNNNWQLLCPKCNEKKSDSFEYQIEVLLKLK